jgi:hypothetical protein
LSVGAIGSDPLYKRAQAAPLRLGCVSVDRAQRRHVALEGLVELLERGFLTNVSNRVDRFDLRPGDPLPEQGELLPTKEELDDRVSGSVRSVSGLGMDTGTRSQSGIGASVRSVHPDTEGAEETLGEAWERFEAKRREAS